MECLSSLIASNKVLLIAELLYTVHPMSLPLFYQSCMELGELETLRYFLHHGPALPNLNLKHRWNHNCGALAASTNLLYL